MDLFQESGSTSDVFLQHCVRASLVQSLDKRVMVVMRDGRSFVGKLITFDQYSNIVLENTIERKTIRCDDAASAKAASDKCAAAAKAAAGEAESSSSSPSQSSHNHHHGRAPSPAYMASLGAVDKTLVKFCDIKLGVYLIRGENVVMIGDVDAGRFDTGVDVLMTRVDEAEMNALATAARDKVKALQRDRAAAGVGGRTATQADEFAAELMN